MSPKRPISFLLVVLFTAVQVAAWMSVLAPHEAAASAMVPHDLLDWLLAVLSERSLLALGGCASIVLGILVGVVGRRPQPAPEVAVLPDIEPAGPH